jgi:4-diphosphocytidyl-2-C-methyl-D-erythritol kinase
MAHAAHGLSERSLSARAPAKVNLSLRVLGRRADGYHLLDSLVVFAGAHDLLVLDPAREFGLTVQGVNAKAAGGGANNLVIKAAKALAERIPGLHLGHFTLTKRLPVAAGLGGGSSDAAAALRLLAKLNQMPSSHPALHEVARSVGADVAVCLAPRARMMRGIGDDLGPALMLPNLFAVLVNPGVAIATADVFQALGKPILADAKPPDTDHPPDKPSASELIDWLAMSANDLAAPAERLVPVIGDMLKAIANLPGCRMARMSGSGATCFGLFDNCRDSADAARTLSLSHPDWWIKPTLLR